MAAGAADVILDATSLAAAGRKKGVMSKVVANAAMGYYGWQLMVLSKSTLGVKDLNGKKVAITSAGSGSDLLALWTMQDKKIDFTRVPVGGGGLVPNLLAGNVDAAVVYSPLSFQIAKSGEARTILDYLQGSAAEPRRRLDRARQIRAGKAASGAEDAERALWRADVHARQQGRHRQADRRTL